jgi:CRISPR-associated protein Cst1
MPDILHWTGHPFVDVGIAAICAMCGKDDPGQLTLEHLDAAAREMQEYYFSRCLNSYLSCVFMDSGYVQPGSGPAKERSRREYAARVLFAHRAAPEPETAGLPCAFSGRPATHLIHRSQMPLLTGQGVLNFYPAGTGALPVNGPFLTALQALPLGGRRTEGKLLVAHSDSPAVTLALARMYVDDNRRLIQLAKAGSLPLKDGPDALLPREQAAWDAKQKCPKYPDAKSAPSLITADLMRVWDSQNFLAVDIPSPSLTVYWMSSSGQGPSLEIFHLPSNLIRFLILVNGAKTRATWNRTVARGWSSPQSGKEDPRGRRKARIKETQPPVPGGPGRSRNSVLSDLLPIYQNGFLDLNAARTFLHRHMLPRGREVLDGVQESKWELTELFLREVFGMDSARVNAIRSFADRLAEYVQRTNDKKLFQRIVYSDKAWEFRIALINAQRNQAVNGGSLLFGLDDYLAVFEAEDSVGQLDWRLTRDLISVRLVEQLHKSGFLDKEMLADQDGIPASDSESRMGD